jgi:hypothetical protein
MGERGFTPGRDHPHLGRLPIRKGMGSAVESTPADTSARNLQLLRDCLALGRPGRRRPPAKVRLEEALGPDLAQRLVESLSRERR